MTTSLIPRNLERTSCADKNDKLPWIGGFSVLSPRGISVGIRSNDLEILERLHNLIPVPVEQRQDEYVDLLFSFLKAKPALRKGSKNYNLVYYDWTRFARTLDLEEALDAFQKLCLIEFAGSGLGSSDCFHPGFAGLWDGHGTAVVGTPELLASARGMLLQKGMQPLSQDFVLWKEAKLAACPTSQSSPPPELPALETQRLIVLQPEPGRRTLTPGQAILGLLAEVFGPESVVVRLKVLGACLAETHCEAMHPDDLLQICK